MTESKTFPSKS